jgi:hypothetical protein
MTRALPLGVGSRRRPRANLRRAPDGVRRFLGKPQACRPQPLSQHRAELWLADGEGGVAFFARSATDRVIGLWRL